MRWWIGILPARARPPCGWVLLGRNRLRLLARHDVPHRVTQPRHTFARKRSGPQSIASRPPDANHVRTDFTEQLHVIDRHAACQGEPDAVANRAAAECDESVNIHGREKAAPILPARVEQEAARS